MRIAVTGPQGRLASWLISHYKCVPLHCDITDYDATRIEVQRIGPDAIIHAAAYTDVDKAEEEKEEALLANVRGTGNIRMSFSGYMIYLSTSYVFNGSQPSPYLEGDEPSPIGQYGWSKYGGEAMMEAEGLDHGLIVRTVSLYGHGPRPDFVSTVLKQLEGGGTLDLPTNLVSNPTYIPHLAMALIECTKQKVTGILNLAGKTVVSRYDWGLAIAKMSKFKSSKIKANEYLEELTQRPGNASFDLTRAQNLGLSLFSLNSGLRELRKWRTQLNPPS